MFYSCYLFSFDSPHLIIFSPSPSALHPYIFFLFLKTFYVSFLAEYHPNLSLSKISRPCIIQDLRSTVLGRVWSCQLYLSPNVHNFWFIVKETRCMAIYFSPKAIVIQTSTLLRSTLSYLILFFFSLCLYKRKKLLLLQQNSIVHTHVLDNINNCNQTNNNRRWINVINLEWFIWVSCIH